MLLLLLLLLTCHLLQHNTIRIYSRHASLGLLNLVIFLPVVIGIDTHLVSYHSASYPGNAHDAGAAASSATSTPFSSNIFANDPS